MIALAMMIAFGSVYADPGHKSKDKDDDDNIPIVENVIYGPFEYNIIGYGTISLPKINSTNLKSATIVFDAELYNTIQFTNETSSGVNVNITLHQKLEVNLPNTQVVFSGGDFGTILYLNAFDDDTVTFGNIFNQYAYDYTSDVTPFIGTGNVSFTVHDGSTIDVGSQGNIIATARDNIKIKISVMYETVTCYCDDPDHDGDCEADEHGKKHKKKRHKK